MFKIHIDTKYIRIHIVIVCDKRIIIVSSMLPGKFIKLFASIALAIYYN